MSRIVDINDNPYFGNTSSAPWSAAAPALECSRCGSSLAGRREAVRHQTTRGVYLVVETFRCRCGRGRRVKREVASR